MKMTARQVPSVRAHKTIVWVSVGLVLLGLCACGDESSEPVRVLLPVVVDDTGVVPVTTDLGYTVELQTFRMSVVDLELTTAGEAHASNDAGNRRHWFQQLLFPSALAHPGHYAGGDVIGELRGRWIVDWIGGEGVTLGTATLLAGDYHGANFTFGTAESGDTTDQADSLIGHNAELSGTASRDGSTVSFHAVIDQDEGRQMVGAPFELIATAETDVILGLQCLLNDPGEGSSLFDGIDFFALDSGSGSVDLEPDTPDYNRLRRGLQVHDHYNISVQ